MPEIDIFSARNNVHSIIKSIPGFVGIGTNGKTNTLVVHVKTDADKQNILNILGEKQYGYYIEYVVRDRPIKFA